MEPACRIDWASDGFFQGQHLVATRTMRPQVKLAPCVAVLIAVLPSCSNGPAPTAPTSPGQVLLTGPVLEQLDAPPYTYLRLKTATGEVWAAVPITGAVDRERPVTILSSGAFKNFYASPAARRFEVLHVGTLEPAVAR